MTNDGLKLIELYESLPGFDKSTFFEAMGDIIEEQYGSVDLFIKEFTQ